MATNLVHNTNVVARGVSRLLFTFRDKPRIVALLTSYLEEIQELEDALFAIWADRLLRGGSLTTEILDFIGKIVGQQREGFDNDTYALLISARIQANRSNGTRAQLIKITSLLVPNTQILFYQFNPQSELIIPFGPVGFDPYLIARSFLLVAAAAGEKLMFGWTSAPIASTLMTGYSLGLGTTVPTVAQSPGWSGNGGPPINGGLLGGAIA